MTKIKHSNLIFRLIAFALITVMLATALFSCKPTPETPDTPQNPVDSDDGVDTGDGTVAEDKNLKIMVLNGTTGMGAASMISKYKDVENAKYSFEIVAAADVVSAAIIGGEVDVAAVPTNLASVLYNKTGGKIRVAAINTKGVLYVLSTNDQIKTVADLEGKTVYAPGLGSNPEYILRHLCESNGLEVGKDVIIDGATYPSPDELATAVASGNAELALLPEPKVTAVTTQNANVKVAINVTEEWEKTFGVENTLVQGCIIIRSEIVEQYPETVKAFLAEYKESVELVNEKPEEAAKLIAAAGIVPKEALALKAIPRCNISYIDGESMVKALKFFFNALYEVEPKSIGGKLPDDALYFVAE